MTRVDILMATKDGARHLPAQLASIAAQGGVDWRLIVSDDGSSDTTRAVVQAFAARQVPGRVTLAPGPCQGAAANFLSLLARPGGGYAALSDQDDIWCAGRLERAVRLLGPAAAHEPRVYASRTWQFSHLHPPRTSRRHPHRPCFENALLQNIVAGNTLVMNAAARDLVRTAGLPEVPFHDWWLYALVTGAGGRVILDDRATLYYRQHDANVLGAHCGLRAAMRRVRGVLGSDYGAWLRSNAAALCGRADMLTPQARDRLDRFCAALSHPARVRGLSLSRSGAFRQDRAGQLCVFGAATLGRI